MEQWLIELGSQLAESGEMTLIGSGGLLWHAAQRGITEPLPENSMDVDPLTDSDEVARRCYDGIIGSDFEKAHGWHINLMPNTVLNEFPPDWRGRASTKSYGNLTVIVPHPADLLVPKLKRNEPRDRSHAEWARRIKIA